MQKLNQYFYVILCFWNIDVEKYTYIPLVILDGEHTSVKTVVTSKVGGLAGFITKKDKCIGCKTVLQEQGKKRSDIFRIKYD